MKFAIFDMFLMQTAKLSCIKIKISSCCIVLFDSVYLCIYFSKQLVRKNPEAEAVLGDKHLKNLTKAHVTLAHKRGHGVAAVASYGIFLHKQVPVELTALLFTDKMAAFEADLGSVDGERVVSKNEWPHVTIWTAEGVAAREANRLPELLAEGKATCIQINPSITVSGTLEFY